MPLRKDLLIDKLKDIFEDTSGIDVDSSDASFIEIGFDSLLLTQIATNLKKEFNVPITFRKLFEEYNSLDLLAAHLDSILPADKFQRRQPHQKQRRSLFTSSLPISNRYFIRHNPPKVVRRP
jgi:acyl carrier protein